MWPNSWIRLCHMSAGKVDIVVGLAQSELNDTAINIAINYKL